MPPIEVTCWTWARSGSPAPARSCWGPKTCAGFTSGVWQRRDDSGRPNAGVSPIGEPTSYMMYDPFMKLVTYLADALPRLGVLDGNDVVDLASADTELPSDMVDLITEWD